MQYTTVAMRRTWALSGSTAARSASTSLGSADAARAACAAANAYEMPTEARLAPAGVRTSGSR